MGCDGALSQLQRRAGSNYLATVVLCADGVCHCVCYAGALDLSFDEMVPLLSEAQAISALAPLRKTKQIYLFDATLKEILENQDDFHIPSELLLQLQFPAIYIKRPQYSAAWPPR